MVDNAARGVWLQGDPTRLSQALLNLLGNAVKFTEHGMVTLRCRLDADPDGGDARRLRLEVQDSGIGIAPSRLRQVFSAFEQADSSTTRRHGGTGLGLAITRHLAELMGGEVGAESQEGVGSVFWFSARLQLGQAGAADMDRSGATDSPARGRAEADAEQALRQAHLGARVLLAEDNAVNQMVAFELLTAAGLVVDLADNGRQAVTLATQQRYDLVLMDVQMPELDGLQATRAIRALPGCQQLPILAMTANAFNEDRLACLAAGMNDHITKPVVPQRLYQALSRWLDQARQGPAGIPLAAAAGPEVAAPTLVTRLAGLPGLDAAAGLRFFAGRSEAYRRGLQHFVTAYAEGLPTGATRPGDLAQLRGPLHSLRGAAATLGASELASRAATLESQLPLPGQPAAGTPDQLAVLLAEAEGLQADLRALAAAIGQRLASFTAGAVLTPGPR